MQIDLNTEVWFTFEEWNDLHIPMMHVPRVGDTMVFPNELIRTEDRSMRGRLFVVESVMWHPGTNVPVQLVMKGL